MTLLEQLTEVREHFLARTSLVKDVTKATGEQPVQRHLRPGRSQGRSLCRVGLGCVDVVASLGALCTLVLGFLWGILTQTRSIIDSISSPSPLSGDVGVRGAEKPKLLIRARSFRCPPRPEPAQHHLVRRKAPAITQEIPRDLGALCREPGPETSMRTDDVSGALITQEIPRV